MYILVFLPAAIEKAHADCLILDWNASTSMNVAGYNVYYGTNSGNYLYKIDAGNAMSVTVSNLSYGVTYYFAATAYDANGDESPFSPEVSFIVPGALYISPAGSAGGPLSLSFPVAPGHWYEIQATTDLEDWTSIWQSDVMTTNAWAQFTDPDTASFAQRFYRLVLH
ncbi:MAG: fibronectin type III domain-containing protein [Verrucomicrobiota bacterium]